MNFLSSFCECSPRSVKDAGISISYVACSEPTKRPALPGLHFGQSCIYGIIIYERIVVVSIATIPGITNFMLEIVSHISISECSVTITSPVLVISTESRPLLILRDSTETGEAVFSVLHLPEFLAERPALSLKGMERTPKAGTF